MTERILVTGATGFIGRHLVRKLAANAEMQLRCIVREGSVDVPGVEVISAVDFTRSPNLPAVLSNVDRVLHLAGLAHVSHASDSATYRMFETINVGGTVALARAAEAAGVRRFVFLSTVTVHGNQTMPGSALTEESPIAPTNAYARSKAKAEAELSAVRGRMAITIVRPPLVYGRGVKGNLRTILNWLRWGMPLPFGAISDNRRTLIGIDNLVDLIAACLEHPAAANETFVAADDVDLSTRELFQKMAASIVRPARLFSVPSGMLSAALHAAGLDPMAERLLGSLRVDASKARRILGWFPRVDVDEGFRRAFGKDSV